MPGILGQNHLAGLKGTGKIFHSLHSYRIRLIKGVHGVEIRARKLQVLNHGELAEGAHIQIQFHLVIREIQAEHIYLLFLFVKHYAGVEQRCLPIAAFGSGGHYYGLQSHTTAVGGKILEGIENRLLHYAAVLFCENRSDYVYKLSQAGDLNPIRMVDKSHAHAGEYQSVQKGIPVLQNLGSFHPVVFLLVVLIPDVPLVKGEIHGLVAALQGLYIVGGAGNGVDILLLTAKAEVEDRIAGLDTGADDYLPKPFVMGELLSRVRAMLRRKDRFTPDIMTFGNVSLNLSSCELKGPLQSIVLPKIEYKLMELLMLNKGIYLSTDDILVKVWGYESDAESGAVWVYISYVRKRLATIGADIEIRAKRSVGYTLAKIGDAD